MKDNELGFVVKDDYDRITPLTQSNKKALLR
jgi:hypothetical protein